METDDCDRPAMQLKNLFTTWNMSVLTLISRAEPFPAPVCSNLQGTKADAGFHAQSFLRDFPAFPDVGDT